MNRNLVFANACVLVAVVAFSVSAYSKKQAQIVGSDEPRVTIVGGQTERLWHRLTA